MAAGMPLAQTPTVAEDIARTLEQTREDWEELRGGRMLITGGTGFFGRWLLSSFAVIEQQLRLGAEAVVLTRDADAFHRSMPALAQAPNIRLIQGDVADFPFPDGSFTHAIHAASELSHAQPTPAFDLMAHSIDSGRHVLEFCRRSGVRKLLYTSSGAVYGPPVPGRDALAEDDALSPLPLRGSSAYAGAKRSLELMAAMWGQQHGIDVRIVRGFAFLGPFLPLDSPLAAAGFLQAALLGRDIVIQGHGQTVRSYLYGGDLATWLWRILFRGQRDRPYNLGSDARVTIAQLAASIAAQSDSPIAVRIMGTRDPTQPLDVYVPDISRARRELALDVFTPLNEAIRRTLRHHREAH